MKKILLAVLFTASITVSEAQEQIPHSINTYMTPEDKLYALSKIWSEAKYNEAFFENVGEKVWDSTYLALIKPVMESKSDNECYRILRRYCAMLKDGHSYVSYEYDPTITTYFDKFQIIVRPIEGRAIVSQISSKQSRWIPVGSEIIEVNGMTTVKYLKKMIIPYISSSTTQYLMDKSISEMFASLKNDQYDITFLTPNGDEIRTHVVHNVLPEIKIDSLVPNEKEWKFVELIWYPDDVAYVAINSFNGKQVVDDFEAVFPELKKRAKGIIIDIRNNGGGNTGYAAQVLSRLTPDNDLVGASWSTRVHKPDLMSWGKYVNAKDTIGNIENKKMYEIANHKYFEKGGESNFTFDVNRERIVVPMAILIGHTTFSAAEDFLVFCDNQKHITLIGEATAGSTGNPITWDLPHGGFLSICSKKDIYPDGREFVGIGIKPDIESYLTVEDFRKGRDTVLETALSFLNNQKK
ncbi:MAG: peptidase S41 [Ignavibacteriales bacterium]|nr:peptidase S41 [Ignavibacteriales bacterium]